MAKLARIALALTAVFLLTAAKPVWSPKTYGPYQADHISTYDGDTFWARIYVWPAQSVAIKVRLMGVDTPETRSGPQRRVPKCEKALAAKARIFTDTFLSQAGPGGIILKQVKPDKYGDRVDALVYVGGRSLTDALIKAGHGRLYDGGSRGAWCKDK